MEQESRTLEMNNVQDGTWHGRGDTICIGSYSEGNKANYELHPPAIISANSSDIGGWPFSTFGSLVLWIPWSSVLILATLHDICFQLDCFQKGRDELQDSWD